MVSLYVLHSESRGSKRVADYSHYFKSIQENVLEHKYDSFLGYSVV
jgi:hypothetical protein